MVLVVKVRLKDANKVRRFLHKKGLFNADFLVKKEGDYVYFPVREESKELKSLEVVDVVLKRGAAKKTEATVLKGELTELELSLLPRSYDVVGDILILELPEGLEKKEKIIGEAFLKIRSDVATVVKKTDTHTGVYRIRKVKVVAGKRKKEAIYKESGLRFKVHLEKMYFSSRLGSERLRVTRQVKKDEEVLVMFSGCAPYCCVIAKHSKARKVYGIEINPEAHKYGVENVRLNKLEGNVKLFLGDVRNVLPKLKKKFDRIVMPLPKTGEQFLGLVLRYVKKGGVVHYYSFLGEEGVRGEIQKIKKECEKSKKKCRILRRVKAGQHKPRVWRVVFDIKVG